MSTVAATTELAWGYTMAEIDRAAWYAARRGGRAWLMEIEDRYEATWGAIVEYLYSAETSERPTFQELYALGLEALNTLTNEEHHHHGYRSDVDGPAPNFGKYWLAPRHMTGDDGFSEHLVETLALPRVLSILTAKERQAIAAMAAHNNDAAAAAWALGLTKSQLQQRVYIARARIKRMWFEHEQPPKPKKTGETCRSGHSRAEHGRLREDGAWVCRRCDRNSARRRAAKESALVRAGTAKWQQELDNPPDAA